MGPWSRERERHGEIGSEGKKVRGRGGQQCLDWGERWEGKGTVERRGKGKREKRGERERRTYDIEIREEIWVDGRFVFKDI